MYGKIEDGVLVYASKNIVLDGATVCNPTDEQMKQDGFKEIRETEMPGDAPAGKMYKPYYTDKGDYIEEFWELVSKPVSLEERMTTMENMMSPTYIVMRATAQTLDDQTAVMVKSFYETWESLCERSYEAKTKGFKFRHGDRLYKTVQDNFIFQSQWVPGEGTASIYTQIPEEGDETLGTLDNPIVVPDDVTTNPFSYVVGKYYKEGEHIYQCKHGSAPDGTEYSFPYKPTQLLNDYFILVE